MPKISLSLKRNKHIGSHSSEDSSILKGNQYHER